MLTNAREIYEYSIYYEQTIFRVDVMTTSGEQLSVNFKHCCTQITKTNKEFFKWLRTQLKRMYIILEEKMKEENLVEDKNFKWSYLGVHKISDLLNKEIKS